MSTMKMLLLLLAGVCELLALGVVIKDSASMDWSRWAMPVFCALFFGGIALTIAASLVVI